VRPSGEGGQPKKREELERKTIIILGRKKGGEGDAKAESKDKSRNVRERWAKRGVVAINACSTQCMSFFPSVRERAIKQEGKKRKRDSH
jgi:hypothetical protein